MHPKTFAAVKNRSVTPEVAIGELLESVSCWWGDVEPVLKRDANAALACLEQFNREVALLWKSFEEAISVIMAAVVDFLRLIAAAAQFFALLSFICEVAKLTPVNGPEAVVSR
ncbi:hypothetical protein GC176_00040 [bacterium]|nr:hypothetical protein [bacterium]